MSPNETKKEVLERLHSWNDKKAELLLTFHFDVPRNRFFQIQVTVFEIRDDYSSITLNWHRQVIDPSHPSDTFYSRRHRDVGAPS